MYGTEVPKSKLGLDLRPGMDPECGTKMPKCELGLELRIGNTAPYLISLFCTALVSYKSESRSLTNARRDFPRQRRKANPTYHRMLGNFLGTSLPGICAWVGTKFQSHKLGFLFSPKHPLRTDNIGPHYRTYLLKLEPSSKATTTIFHNFPLSAENHLEQETQAHHTSKLWAQVRLSPWNQLWGRTIGDNQKKKNYPTRYVGWVGFLW